RQAADAGWFPQVNGTAAAREAENAPGDRPKFPVQSTERSGHGRAHGLRRRFVDAALRTLHASMFENRDLRTDLVALALAVVTLFMAVALLWSSPADPVADALGMLGGLYRPDALIHPLNESVQNACGRWGAVAADVTLNLLGIGAYYLVGSLAIVAVHLLRRQPVDAPYLRALGWIGSLLGLVTLAQMLAPGLTPGPVIGSGGYLGALTSGWLSLHFATFGG